jgi:anti-sigma regulatory factor (Ser/Thr protein kinase)
VSGNGVIPPGLDRSTTGQLGGGIGVDYGSETPTTSAVTLPAEVASTPRARRFVRAALSGILSAEVIAAAELCVSELVTNAVLHAGTPVRIHLTPVSDGIRISVQDGSPAMPLRVRHSRTAATGRGLALVTAMARSWGVDVRDGGGKAVWCELASTAAEPTDEEALLAAWDDDVDWDDLDVRRALAADEANQTGRATRAHGLTETEDGAADPIPGEPVVRYRGYPIVLSMRLQEHYEALTRECQLLWAAARRSSEDAPHLVDVPRRLAQLAEDLAVRYAGSRSEPDRQRLEAFALGEDTATLVYPIIPELKEQILALREVLAEMDEYSRSNALLTLSTPPDLNALTDWLLEEYLRQADGHPPHEWNGPLR